MRALAILVAFALALALAAAPARAEPTCAGEASFSLLRVHYGLEPAAHDRLGLDLRVHGVEIGWGGGCDVRRHAFELSDAEAPEYGDDGRAVVRLLTYRHGWQGDGVTAHVGVRGLVQWGDRWRFLTVVAGGSVTAGEALVRVELELGGLSLATLDARVDHRRTDLALDASAVWPAGAATRAEVRLRVRDLAMPAGPAADVHDVTLAAGVGLALAVRDGLRGLPGFVGLAARTGDHPATLVVVEWGLGAGGR